MRKREIFAWTVVAILAYGLLCREAYWAARFFRRIEDEKFLFPPCAETRQ